MTGSLLLALHLLGAVVWVGGMAFSLLVLRPSLAVLEPAQRIALHRAVFQRFFRIVWHAMPIVILSGYAMVFGVFGGFAGVAWPVHVMHGLGLVMAGVFVWIVIDPYAALKRSQAVPEAAKYVDRIRKLIQVNLLLGGVVVTIAAFA